MADFNKIIIGPNFKDSLAEVQLMEKTDSLPRKDGVHGLFIAHGSGSRKYYLNIFNSDNLIDKNKYFSLLIVMFHKAEIKDPIKLYNSINDFQKKSYYNINHTSSITYTKATHLRFVLTLRSRASCLNTFLKFNNH